MWLFQFPFCIFTWMAIFGFFIAIGDFFSKIYNAFSNFIDYFYPPLPEVVDPDAFNKWNEKRKQDEEDYMLAQVSLD